MKKNHSKRVSFSYMFIFFLVNAVTTIVFMQAAQSAKHTPQVSRGLDTTIAAMIIQQELNKKDAGSLSIRKDIFDNTVI